jgi:PAS domain S-box-containing protein
MILADELGRILYANTACKRFLGYRPSELVGRLGFDLCRPEHLPRARDAFARCLAHPATPITLEVDISHRGGGFRSLAVKLVNRLPAPGIKAVVVHFRDATAGVSQANLPDEREEPHRVLFDHAPVGLGVADMEGNLLAFNEAMLQPGGYTREDMLGITNVWQLYCHAPDRDRVLAVARERGFVWREEVQFRRKDGGCYDTLLTLTPVRFRDRPCWYAMVEDISERRRAEDERLRLEAQLRQAQKMEAVGRMTSGIAHDFNNVLSVIMTNAELMGSDLGPAEAELRDELAELQGAAERGAAMIRKLLGFSRRADLQPKPTELGDLLARLRGMLRHIIPEGITLEITSAPGSVALADPAAVEQMVLNLATNARDAMEMSGTVRIDVGPVVIDRGETASRSWMQPGEFIRLTVADTGEGMNEETRAHALEPFFTTKPAGVGTGLGLPMVYGLVKQHHGYIEIASELGKGTTVSLYFPKVAQSAPVVPELPPRS